MANECTAIIKLVGVPGAAPTGFKHVCGESAGVLAGLVGDKFMRFVNPGTVSLYRVADDKKNDAKIAYIKDEKDAIETFGATLVDAEEGLAANSWLLAIGTLTTPPSAQGKCPHSIVFPSVARSSLTWSLCFVSPLLWLLVQEVEAVVAVAGTCWGNMLIWKVSDLQ
jgi:hypothetical protein